MSEREPQLIGLLSVLLAVAVHSVARRLLLLGQLGLRGQQGGEGEETGGGGDGGEARLAQAQRQRGHRQSQALELRQLVSLELLLHRMTTRHGLDREGGGRGEWGGGGGGGTDGEHEQRSGIRRICNVPA